MYIFLLWFKLVSCIEIFPWKPLKGIVLQVPAILDHHQMRVPVIILVSLIKLHSIIGANLQQQRNHITNESMTHTRASFSRWKLESKLEKFKRKLLWYWGTRKVSTTVLKSQVHVRVIDLYCWTVAVIACSTGSLSMLDAP